jgi:hypothetical protein
MASICHRHLTVWTIYRQSDTGVCIVARYATLANKDTALGMLRAEYSNCLFQASDLRPFVREISLAEILA